ncbi:MAG: BatD family protein, partial [Planctomycetota bacterium]
MLNALISRKLSALGIACFVVIACASRVDAARVEASISNRQTYLNFPVDLEIKFIDVQDHQAPTLMPVDGLIIESLGQASRSTQRFSINGRTTSSSTLSYRFRIIPERLGTFTIPALTLEFDDRKKLLPPIELKVVESDGDGLLFAEIAGSQSEIYVGQQLDLTLRIWVKPFKDLDRGVELNEYAMWQCCSKRTSWGPFEEAIRALEESRRRPGGELVLRKDLDGNQQPYYLYEIDASIYPQAPGPLDVSGCRVAWDYPTSIGNTRSRSPLDDFFNDDFARQFFSRDPLRDALLGSRRSRGETRPVVVEAKGANITVKPV